MVCLKQTIPPSNFLKAVFTNFTCSFLNTLFNIVFGVFFVNFEQLLVQKEVLKENVVIFGNPYLTLFNPTGKYMLKVNKKSLILVCRLSSKLILKTSEHYY